VEVSVELNEEKNTTINRVQPSSPPGTGKTSLIQLIIQNLQGAADNSRSCVGSILGPSRPSKPGFALFDFVKSRTGVSYEDKALKSELQAYSEVWLLFDDAQKLYGA